MITGYDRGGILANIFGMLIIQCDFQAFQHSTSQVTCCAGHLAIETANGSNTKPWFRAESSCLKLGGAKGFFADRKGGTNIRGQREWYIYPLVI